MKYKVLVVLLFFCMTVSSQVTNEGEPWSWKVSKEKKNKISPTVMKSFDLNKIKAEDAKNDIDKSIPWRFGHELNVKLNLKNSGVWDDLPNGRIWRINIVSKGAKTLNFIFDSFRIPEGATVYLYNNDKSDLLGAYTSVFNRPDKMLGTWLVEGESVHIEYFEPYGVKEKGELSLAKVVHGYRTITEAQRQQKALGSSQDCNQDVDCPVGADFDPVKDKLKRSVALLILGGGVCSGTLINNTNNDRKPYFLTANHCFISTRGTEDPSTWAFRFNWISPDPSCATTTPSTDGIFNQTTSGATVLANNSGSDFALVNIDTDLPSEWNLEWAGWDRTGDVPEFVVGIHHPNGDIMKVCREDDPLGSSAQEEILGLVAPVNSWIVNDWDLGVTEGGSSGSAIFDPAGRIIGQLAGGGAACAGTNDNGLPDFYGKFDVSWCSSTTDSSNSLSTWLDPGNTKRTKLNMLSEELNGQTSTETDNIACGGFEGDIVVFPNPTEGSINVSSDVGENLTYLIYDIFGRLVSSGRTTPSNQRIELVNKSSGMYFIYFENTSNGAPYTRRILVK